MMKLKLPRGLKYRMETPKPGKIIPGSDNEPIVTIFGRGTTIQYKLISCALGQDGIIQDTYEASNLSDDEINEIDSWVEYLIPSLLKDIGINHFIRFLPDSQCYYDFTSQTLFGAYGYKEKKGAREGNRENSIQLNGNPCKLTKSEIAIIELLTRTPNTLFSREDLEDWSGIHTAGSINSTWSRFKKYDSSIQATFDRKNGMFFYKGTPQIWVLGEDSKEIQLTLYKLFTIIGYGDVIAAITKTTNTIDACLTSDAEPRNILSFLGLDHILSDDKMPLFATDRLVTEGHCKADFLNSLLARFSISLNAIWKTLRDRIGQNLSLSLNASIYHYETKEIPARLTDLKGYSVTNERLERSLQRICPSIKELIETTNAGIDFFGYCDISVKPNTVIDYIVALILVCFCYCQSDEENEQLSQHRTRYQSKLTDLIRERFNYSPPSDGKETIIEEIQRLLIELQVDVEDVGLDSAVSKVSKINDLLNLLGYNDANSLLPHSKGREI